MPPSYKNLVKAAVAQVRRKNWWVDTEELTQIAELVKIEAQLSFDPTVKDANFDKYFWVIVKRALSDYVMQTSSPISATRSNRKALIGTVRAIITDANLLEESKLGRLPDEILFERQLKRAVRDQVSRNSSHLESSLRKAVSAVLIAGLKPSEAAENFNVDTTKVYTAVKNVKKRLRTCKNMKAYWEDIWK